MWPLFKVLRTSCFPVEQKKWESGKTPGGTRLKNLYWIPVIFGPSGDTALTAGTILSWKRQHGLRTLSDITACEHGSPGHPHVHVVKRHHAKKQPRTINMIQKHEKQKHSSSRSPATGLLRSHMFKEKRGNYAVLQLHLRNTTQWWLSRSCRLQSCKTEHF